MNDKDAVNPSALKIIAARSAAIMPKMKSQAALFSFAYIIGGPGFQK